METRQLRAIGHHLKPVVTVAGAGLTNNVSAEIDRALHDHELIKLRISMTDRQARETTAHTICTEQKAQLIQHIGKTILILRRNSHPNPKTSNLIRHLGTL